MATQIAMGPWFVRDEKMPFAPGCSYQIIKRKAQAGKLTAESVIRGPGTHQFWMQADKVPGVAHLVGVCHQCGDTVEPNSPTCPSCHAMFNEPQHRNELGLQYPTEEALHQARVHLDQLKDASTATPPTPAKPAPVPRVATAPPAAAPQPKVDDAIGLMGPLASSMPLPEQSDGIPTPKPQPEHEDQPTQSIKTADLNRQTQKLSLTVITMIIFIVVLMALIVMLYLGSQKPGGVTGKSPIKRELGTTGALKEETLPKVDQTKQPADDTAQLPDPVGSLDLHQIISDARELEQQGNSGAALAKLQGYAQTLKDGKLPFDLETEITRIKQKIAREKAASFFRSGQ